MYQQVSELDRVTLGVHKYKRHIQIYLLIPLKSDASRRIYKPSVMPVDKVNWSSICSHPYIHPCPVLVTRWVSCRARRSKSDPMQDNWINTKAIDKGLFPSPKLAHLTRIPQWSVIARLWCGRRRNLSRHKFISKCQNVHTVDHESRHNQRMGCAERQELYLREILSVDPHPGVLAQK